MLQTLTIQTEPQVMNAPEERSITEWQQRYPDSWLLLEVTQEDEGDPLAGRLIAVAPEDMTLVPLWQEQARQGKVTALLYGRFTEAAPTVIAC